MRKNKSPAAIVPCLCRSHTRPALGFYLFVCLFPSGSVWKVEATCDWRSACCNQRKLRFITASLARVGGNLLLIHAISKRGPAKPTVQFLLACCYSDSDQTGYTASAKRSSNNFFPLLIRKVGVLNARAQSALHRNGYCYCCGGVSALVSFSSRRDLKTLLLGLPWCRRTAAACSSRTSCLAAC